MWYIVRLDQCCESMHQPLPDACAVMCTCPEERSSGCMRPTRQQEAAGRTVSGTQRQT